MHITRPKLCIPIISANVLPAIAWMLLILIGLPDSAAGGELESVKIAGGYEVKISVNRNPPGLGENRLEIALRDSLGKTVTDASVLVNYYMPPMPRMAPMNYRVNAPVKGGKYRAAMHFIMEGPWIIALKINRAGKMTTVKFNVDAR